MSDSLIDDSPEGVNTPEYSVSEISGAVKRAIEGGFGHVRVRGEIGRVSRPRSGHVYLDLKDERAVLSGVIWKGAVRSLTVQPEEGDEVVATGRLTTFPGQSKYQIVIEQLAYAGAGALLAKLERLKATLGEEGLFAAERKRSLPYLPATIGVVTSPSGAVIRDILHRLAERFPVRVIVWPVAVQGATCAPEVAAAIRGFGALPPGGPIPRPDVLIVARGGGSVEDLWGFNEEIVVRAAASSPIPLISAVGHETDTTLIDLAADRRAPTPTAAAEMAVPVRAELAATMSELEARRTRAMARGIELRRQRLVDLARALPRPSEIIAARQQRLDTALARLPRPESLTEGRRERLGFLAFRLPRSLARLAETNRLTLGRSAARLAPRLVAGLAGRLRERLDDRSARLGPAAGRAITTGRERLETRTARLPSSALRAVATQKDRLSGAARLLETLGYRQTLARGYAVVRSDDGAVLTDAAALAPAASLSIEFRDGQVSAVVAGKIPHDPRARAPQAPPRRKKPGAGQSASPEDTSPGVAQRVDQPSLFDD